MARIRTIKPEFWTDEVVVELDYADRLLFIGLWNFADDQGYLPLRPKRIKMQVFPGDDYDVLEGLHTLWKSSLVALYAHPEGLLLHIRNWKRHQKISNPARERYQAADLQELDEWTTTLQRSLESYPAEGKGREGKGRETTSSEVADATPDPEREEVTRLCDHLADRIERNAGKRPAIGKKWHDAARLMLDKDDYTEAQIHWLIDKASDDEFWRTNILSMPKLREKATQLKLKFQRETGTPSNVRHLPSGEVDPTSIQWSHENAWMHRPRGQR